jgi:hypothetical protein
MPEEREPRKKFDVLGYFKRWRRIDWIALSVLIILIILVSIPVYLPKDSCEIARPGYVCESAKNVMIENCVFWGEYGCESCQDWKVCAHPSLPQIEWYIGNLCEIHNRYHAEKFDCSNLKLACNQATGTATCPGL